MCKTKLVVVVGIGCLNDRGQATTMHRHWNQAFEFQSLVVAFRLEMLEGAFATCPTFATAGNFVVLWGHPYFTVDLRLIVVGVYEDLRSILAN